MAIDDVVSSYQNSVANNGALSIQPASGDEWLVTQLMSQHSGTMTIRSHGDTNMTSGIFAGATSVTEDMQYAGTRSFKFLVTNSEYIKLYNNASGATKVLGFSAIKTKD